MYIAMIDRAQVKQQANTLVQSAQVNAKKMTVLYLGLGALLSTGASLLPSVDIYSLMLGWGVPEITPIIIAGTFVSVLTTLVLQVLFAGYVLYCMGLRREEKVGYVELFDGFSFAGKVIFLMVLETAYVWLWSCLFVIPGIIASYRYRFALLNLCQNPELSASEALELSKQQTRGYKMQIFMLDFSYFPWMALAQVPICVLYGIELNVAGLGALTLPSIPVQILITSLWAMVVACFYYPQYQTSEILYFDITNHVDSDESQRKIGEMH